MFNLLVSGSGWAPNRDTMMLGRALNYTRDDIKERFQPGGVLDFPALFQLPTLFMEEGKDNEVARIGTIARAQITGRDIHLEYFYDPEIPPMLNSDIVEMARELSMNDWEFNNTHWAVKDVDLFRVLLRQAKPVRTQPSVFNISEIEQVEPDLASAMMPFSPQFDAVYTTLRDAAAGARMRIQRADDIWEHPSIMQDIVSLIDRSSVVICDCSGRNPNVFYEVGIAHTLGREVILITQSMEDIPFDLRHLRCIPYLNNGEGREALKTKVQTRLIAIR